jgi:hypothetical protein
MSRALGTPSPGTPSSGTSHRREVRTMIRKLQGVLLFHRKPAPRQTTRFNGQLLDQKREDFFLAMHQIGLIR